MKKIMLLFFLLHITPYSYAQSKKEQIASLLSENDSLSRLIHEANIRHNKMLYDLNDSLLSLSNRLQILENIRKQNDLNIGQLQDSLIQIQNKLDESRNQSVVPDALTRYADFIDLNDFLDAKMEFEFDNTRADIRDNAPILTGRFVSYYDYFSYEHYLNGRSKMLFAEGNYFNGKKEGEWRYFLCDGTLALKGNFINGKRSGDWKCFAIGFVQGTRLEIDSYSTTAVEIFNFYFDESERRNDFDVEVFNFKDGFLSDTIKYLKNGKLQYYLTTHDTLFYFDNGQLLLSGMGDNGNRIVNFYNGQLRSKEYYINGSREGLASTYYENGQLESVGQFSNGQGVGIWTYYDSNGNLKHRGNWISDDGKYGPEGPCQ